jgi:hypothetical protein
MSQHPLQPEQFDAAEAHRQSLIDGGSEAMQQALLNQRKQGYLGAVTGRINYGGND